MALGGLLPLRPARRLGRWLGGLAHRVAVRERERASLAAVASLGPTDGPRVVAAAFRNLGESAAELVKRDALMQRFDRSGRSGPVRLAAADRARLDAALAAGRGVVYVTAHLGNWELMAAYLAWLGYPIWTVARASYDPRLTRFIHRWREGAGVHAVVRDSTRGGDAKVARECLRALRRGRVLGLLLDQDLGPVPSVIRSFLGRPARVALGPAELALRSGAEVIAGFISRESRDAHRLRLERVPVDPDTSPEELATRLNEVIEKAIGRAPDEWVWMHPRWRGASALQGEAKATTITVRAHESHSDPAVPLVRPRDRDRGLRDQRSS